MLSGRDPSHMRGIYAVSWRIRKFRGWFRKFELGQADKANLPVEIPDEVYPEDEEEEDLGELEEEDIVDSHLI